MELGKYAVLKVHKDTPQGIYLIDEEGTEVLLPNRYVPKDIQHGDDLNVFIYQDSEHRIVATTLEPKIKLHEFAYLKVKTVAHFGAFLDWGLAKDIFCPLREQPKELEENQSYTVFMYIDKQTDRLVVSAKVDNFIETENIDLTPNQEVNLLICNQTPLGYMVIINNKYKGLLYENEIFKPLKMGQKTKGYIKAIREDKKIDVSIHPLGVSAIEPNAQVLMDELKKKKGFLPLTDHSDPALITKLLEMSKKNFKKAVGSLYKKKLIRIEEDGIYLVE